MKTSELREIYLFSRLSDHTLAELAGVLETRRYADGEHALPQGRPGRRDVYRPGGLGGDL